VCSRGTAAIVGAATAENLFQNVQNFGDFGGGDTHGGDGSWRLHRLTLPHCGGGQCTACRSQVSPRRKQASQTPIRARSLCSCLITRPPQPPALICMPSPGPPLAKYRSGRPQLHLLTCLPHPHKRVHTRVQ
jgi:hypothetical protein